MGLDAFIAIDHVEIVLGTEGEVLFLEAFQINPEAFVSVRAQAEIHAGSEVVEVRAPPEDTIHGCFQSWVEKESDVGLAGELIKARDPIRWAVPDNAPGKGREDVTITKDEVASLQEWEEVTIVEITEIGRMKEGIASWSDQIASFLP